MIRATLAVAKATFTSTARSKLSVALILFSIGLFAAISLMTASSLNEGERLLKDLGLFLGSTIASLSTLALCAQTLYRDLERKSLFTLASKPVSRSVIIWGKFIGICLTSAALVSLFCLAWFILAWRLSIPWEMVMLKAWFLVWLESVLIGSVAMMFGSFSSPLMSSILAFGVMLIGRFSEDIVRLQEKSVKTGESNIILDFARDALIFVPPLPLFNVTEQVVYRSPIPQEYLLSATLTSIAYSAICVMLACFLFERRDLT